MRLKNFFARTLVLFALVAAALVRQPKRAEAATATLYTCANTPNWCACAHEQASCEDVDQYAGDLDCQGYVGANYVYTGYCEDVDINSICWDGGYTTVGVECAL